MNLTKKQKQVLDFILDYTDREGVAPSYSEIQANFGFKAKSSVQSYIFYLKKAGFLNEDSSQPRSLKPKAQNTPTNQHILKLPLLGNVAAGLPLDTQSNQDDKDLIEVPSHLVGPGEHYLLKTQGNSMIEDGILDQDLLIIRAQNTAHNGDTVVALVDGGATVKRYYKFPNRIELHPANSAMSPIVVQGGDFSIQGTVQGLVRIY